MNKVLLISLILACNIFPVTAGSGPGKNFGIIFAPNKKNDMRIIAKSTLVEFYTKNPKAKTALEDWYEKTRNAEWTCFADIKHSFNSVDSVGNKRYVFNIKGNDYRLVVVILFTGSSVT